MVLGRENIAGTPAHGGAKMHQSLDQNRGLDGHMQATGNARTVQRTAVAILLLECHEAGHFLFGDRDFLVAPIGEADVGDLIVVEVGHVWSLLDLEGGMDEVFDPPAKGLASKD